MARQLVRKEAIHFVKGAYGSDLAISRVQINPFLLSMEVHDIALPDVDGRPLLNLRRIFLDFELSSLWRRAWVFRNVELASPAVRVVLRNDGSINLVDLAFDNGTPDANAASPAIPRVWIQSLAVTDGSVEIPLDVPARRKQCRQSPRSRNVPGVRNTPWRLADTCCGHPISCPKSAARSNDVARDTHRHSARYLAE